MKNLLTLAVLSATSLIFLTACGSGSGSDANATPTPTITDRVASQSYVIAFVDSNSPRSNNKIPNYTYDQTEDTFSVRRSEDDNTINMTVNEVVYNLFPDSDGMFYLGHYIGSLDSRNTGLSDIGEVIDGTHATVEGMHVFYSTEVNHSETENHTFGYTTIGVQTLASAVATQTATANYNGRISIRTQLGKIAINPSQSRLFFGTTDMQVDFDEMMVSGGATLSGFNVDTDTITFSPTPIVGNGFSGNFTLDERMRRSLGLTDNPTGSYAGNFFGDNADDVAGVMQINGTTDEGAIIGIGGFRGDRQTSE